ncbi:MAG: Tol-Pal system protein TolB [Alphaproteobacteria bacterium]|nr:Tol-Pal system protein TolB [Alphaproteobacteria bacterium]
MTLASTASALRLGRRSLLAGAAAGAALASFARPTAAEVRINLRDGRPVPIPIALSPFFGAGADAQTGAQIRDVIADDLERCGLFQPIAPAAYIQSADQLRAATPRFADWRQINAQALVHGVAELQRDGRLRVEFRLWDVFGESQMEGRVYTTQATNWRRVAHIIADAIYKRVTGEDGYFDTRVVYISETGPLQRRVKRLAIMDQDGANHRFLTDGRFLVLTPRFSPTAQEITYLSYVNNRPRVYLYNIDTGRQEIVGDFPGMTFAPRFSPDGNRVIMSMAQDGVTNIFSQDLRTKRVTRLTSSGGIDTSPCFSPDGREITFNSDRGGAGQIYIMGADGSNARRISFGTGRYYTPVWSPRGDLIAFTKQEGGEFLIGVMRPDGSGERLIDRSFHVEGPTWAPNGRVLMYFSEGRSDSRGLGKNTRLYSIDLTGYNKREVITPTEASDPAWSPLIP